MLLSLLAFFDGLTSIDWQGAALFVGACIAAWVKIDQILDRKEQRRLLKAVKAEATAATAQSAENSQKIDEVSVKQEAAASSAASAAKTSAEAKAAVVQTNKVVAAKLDAQADKLEKLDNASEERSKLLAQNNAMTEEIRRNTNGPHTAVARQAAWAMRKLADSFPDNADYRRQAEEAEAHLRLCEQRQKDGQDSGIFKAPESMPKPNEGK